MTQPFRLKKDIMLFPFRFEDSDDYINRINLPEKKKTIIHGASFDIVKINWTRNTLYSFKITCPTITVNFSIIGIVLQ